MTTREQRVIRAFLDCVYWGKFTAAYVTVLVEDDARYGWMSEAAKEELYSALEEQEARIDAEALEDDGDVPPIEDVDLDQDLEDE